MNIDQLAEDLKREEGFVEYPYDDANDARVQAGYTVQGTVTIGYGFTWLSEEEASVVLKMRATRTASELLSGLPWAGGLSEPRQRALADMLFNLGMETLLSFTTFLGLLQSGQFADAADDLARTRWHQQVGQRAIRIEGMIRNG